MIMVAECIRMLLFLTAFGAAIVAVAGCNQQADTETPDNEPAEVEGDNEAKIDIDAPGVDIEVEKTPEEGEVDIRAPGLGVDVDGSPAVDPE